MTKTMEKRLYRLEVPMELTWNLDDLFTSKEAWEAELKEINEDLTKFDTYKGQLHTGAKVLLECLSAQEQLTMRLSKTWTYASLNQATDGTDPANQENSAKFSALRTKINASLSFINSEVLSLAEGTVERYLQEEAGLQPFRKNLLELLETKKHKLSSETEAALAALGEVYGSPYHLYEIAKSADMQFAPIHDQEGNELPVSFALFESRYEFSSDTDLRRESYASFVDTLKKYRNTIATAYATEVNKQRAFARLRKYETITHMLLEPHQISLEMYHNQIDIIFKELAPHMRRFALLKKKELGLDKMMFCDLKAPLDPDFNPETTYEEASQLIFDSLKVLGPEYSAMMEKGFNERWVDLADNVGKSTGAFCSSPYGVHPYILITWQNNMRGTFTLAHEFGHAGHFYLAHQHQRIMNTRPSMYFIEAPSTLNELLLAQHLLAGTADNQMKRWVILQLLGTYYHNFVTHLLEAEFQRRVYDLAEKGEALTANKLSEITGAVLSEFWGDTVEIDEGAKLTWMRQPHYYMGLYPYTYSAGLTASTAVAELIQKEGQPAVDRWLEVLRAGGTMKPLELLKHAGIDMSKPDPIKKAVSYVGSLINQLEQSYQ
ncbi:MULTISPECIES: oligoendopeptidase F [unclassified Bacillus (in: firmicutes)]|uniref:oligoendopeptidase F n=1 Tax=unclassified Bacillus (in: firmicutes) TaxID=185979 RepID=UPI0008E01806|nr:MULTISPECIES: oligoendopeptidase F [unclassified Bacillus (in: firmicutes)]SFB09680.1 oligoendopeptidase F [Bacillus sp. UNCCL13]SFQ86611.1 oligoendopeptidase F [Bacillus sp. cl95]